METKKITIKRAIVLFWKGLTGIIAATAECLRQSLECVTNQGMGNLSVVW